ncbi:hypothetical protein ABZ553_02455 [Streptomyces sparsogenes]|uniref:hypothetical protein n=1 Tax=Streptomyces sparsogenes TaxID=67365 RepID=UPI0033D314BC
MARSEYEYSRRRVLQASALAFATVLSPWSTAAGLAPSAGTPERAVAQPVWGAGRANPVTVLVRNTGTKDREVTARLVTPDDVRRDTVTQRGKPIVLRVPVPAGKHTV